MTITEGALVAELLVTSGAVGGALIFYGLQRFANPWIGRRRRQR